MGEVNPDLVSVRNKFFPLVQVRNHTCVAYPEAQIHLRKPLYGVGAKPLPNFLFLLVQVRNLNR